MAGVVGSAVRGDTLWDITSGDGLITFAISSMSTGAEGALTCLITFPDSTHSEFSGVSRAELSSLLDQTAVRNYDKE